MNRKIIPVVLSGVFASALVLGPVLGPDASLYAEAAKTPVSLLGLIDRKSVIHEVRPGDHLTRLSKKYRQTAALIKKANGLKSDILLPGQKLKIPAYTFNLVVDKSQNTLLLKGDEEVLKTYVVATGENNSTPVGVFKIADKLVNPAWYKAGAVVPFGSPENILGTRWLGLTKKSYGIHGTTEPEKLGRQVTAGCVRMRNEDVEELFDVVLPGTEVTIVD
ncbi:MAG: L,D-transpeptidase family protein [Candidatus Omnitrophica bacterium]|nr:L,D-transpeptidase family protein [Candidatus Omnitrophota bacterium]